MKYRIENDSIGKVNVPIDAYFGSQTIRASQNFPLSNFIFQKSFINAIVLIKLSAAKAIMELKLLNETKFSFLYPVNYTNISFVFISNKKV